MICQYLLSKMRFKTKNFKNFYLLLFIWEWNESFKDLYIKSSSQIFFLWVSFHFCLFITKKLETTHHTFTKNPKLKNLFRFCFFWFFYCLLACTREFYKIFLYYFWVFWQKIVMQKLLASKDCSFANKHKSSTTLQIKTWKLKIAFYIHWNSIFSSSKASQSSHENNFKLEQKSTLIIFKLISRLIFISRLKFFSFFLSSFSVSFKVNFI